MAQFCGGFSVQTAVNVKTAKCCLNVMSWQSSVEWQTFWKMAKPWHVYICIYIIYKYSIGIGISNPVAERLAKELISQQFSSS